MSIVTSIIRLEPSLTCIEDDIERKFYWEKLLEYWGLPPTFQHFPGANPISIERKDIETIVKHDYLVALKTDGVRYLLLMTTKPNSTEPISIMIDRTLKMYEIEIWASEEYYFKGCLLEGELVWDSCQSLNYIVFDVIMLKGLKCNDMNYRNRLDVIQNHIFSADDNIDDETLENMLSEEDKFCARNNSYNLQIQPKMCVSKHQLSTVWDGKNMCSHKNDGIIFTMNDRSKP